MKGSFPFKYAKNSKNKTDIHIYTLYTYIVLYICDIVFSPVCHICFVIIEFAAFRTRYKNLLFKMEDALIPLSIRWKHLRNEFSTENRSCSVWFALMTNIYMQYNPFFFCSVPIRELNKEHLFCFMIYLSSLWHFFSSYFCSISASTWQIRWARWVTDSRRSILCWVLLLTVFSLFSFRWLKYSGSNRIDQMSKWAWKIAEKSKG